MRARTVFHSNALTFLELLIVVAVVCVLAMMIGRSLQPDCVLTRSPVSRVMADQKSMATALESFEIDNKRYPTPVPFAAGPFDLNRLRKAGGIRLTMVDPGRPGMPGLTTPVAYLESLRSDPFAPDEKMPIAYYTDGHGWILLSPGPDHDYDIDPATDYDSAAEHPTPRLILLTYDPTNGADSNGDIWRTQQGI